MKKISIILFLIIILLTYPSNSFSTDTDKTDIISSQKESVDIGKFINEAEKYTKEVFKDTDIEGLLNTAISGNIDNQSLVKNILGLFGKETMVSIRTIASIMIVIIIHSILKSISEGLENKSIGQISYYIQYILIVTLIISNFAEIITMVKDSVINLVSFSNTLIPILITLVLTTGNVVSANLIQPILLFLITFIGNFILNIIIPIVLASTTLGIVSKISDRVQLDKLSKFLKSGSVWILAVILTIFVSVLSIEGSLSSSVDGVTAKTAKVAVSSFIPVVGKILGDAVDTVIGCTSILKNAVGIVGVIVIIGICIKPIIKLLLLMAIYYIGAAICEPIADSKIVKLLQQMGDTFKILLAILCSLSVMLIIGTTLVMKISNSSLMYR
ncbi:MAG: stage III sporulation protein AE [Clostridiaceae bacterium]|nr:stage III sporulation protein AE [Clostridiaceae bacterium]